MPSLKEMAYLAQIKTYFFNFFGMKLLLFGASGNVGRHIARVAHQRGYQISAVVRSQQKADLLRPFATQILLADVTKPNELEGICRGYDVVISALGKSVSPNDQSWPSFEAIDLDANTHILEQAQKAGVQKFVYLSAFGAEHYPHLTYFRVHHLFSERLRQSGIDYSIIKPPALFSAYADMIPMAHKGRLVSMGPGSHHTNPIYEGDLAELCVDTIHTPNAIVAAGGKKTYTRRQLLEILQQHVAPAHKVRTVPMPLIRISLPILRLVNRNLYDKVAFFAAVMEHDVIAPQVGTTTFEAYLALSKAGGSVVEN